jgi:hypothetical protein
MGRAIWFDHEESHDHHDADDDDDPADGDTEEAQRPRNAMRRTSHLATRPPNVETESGRSGTRRRALVVNLRTKIPTG